MRNIYEEVKNKADPFIKSYRDDLLVHDKKTIGDNPTTPFLHFTGATGTHIVFLNRADKYPKDGEVIKYLFGYVNREDLLREEISVVKGMNKRYGRGDLALHFDGRNLKEISYRQAEAVADEYVEKTKRAWNGGVHENHDRN